MIISTVSLKGGAGKTTTAINLAVYFAKKNYSVILVDSDVNENLSRWNEIRETQNENLNPIDFIKLNNESDFKNEFDEVTQNYDIVIIDGRPAINSMAGLILSISDLSIFPVKPSPLDMWTNDHVFIDVFESAKKVNSNLKGYYLINSTKPNTNIAYECRIGLEGIKTVSKAELFKSELADRTDYAVSIAQGLGVMETQNYKAIGEVKRLGDEISNILGL